MPEFVVDFAPVRHKLQLALKDFSVEVQRRATYNALNAVCDPLRTAVRRYVRDQTGAKYGRVAKAIQARRAHPNRLTYELRAKDTAIPLIDFAAGVKDGQSDPSASPWNETRKFRGAFVVRFGDGQQIVKRVAKHSRSRAEGHKLGVRMMWGPIIPKEMIRPNTPSLRAIAETVPQRLVPRLLHELNQAQLRAKAESGT